MSHLTLKEQLEQLKIKQKLPEYTPEPSLKDIPTEAVTFQLSCVQFADSDPETKNPPRFSMEAYSGGVIKDHWYWGDLIIDLEGMKLPGKPIPSLRDHNPGQIVGWTEKIDTSRGAVDVEGVFSRTTDAGKEALALAREHFPWQASVYVPVTSIEEVKKDEDVTVNGHKLKGPLTIFRKTTLAEVSFCALGADSNTSAVAMAHKGETVTAELLTKQGGTPMTLDELKEKYPELLETFRAEAVAEVTIEHFADEIEGTIKEAVAGERDRVMKLHAQAYGEDEAKRFS